MGEKQHVFVFDVRSTSQQNNCGSGWDFFLCFFRMSFEIAVTVGCANPPKSLVGVFHLLFTEMTAQLT